MHYEDADDLIQTDNRTPAQKWLDAEIERRHGNEQGHEAAIYEIALELRQELEDAQGEIRALRATEAGLRDRLAAVEADRAQRVPDGLTLAAIGHKHFGNPIPQAWYAAAKELLASTPSPAQQEPSEAEMVCAEAYQVVGCLLSDLGLFETVAARKILDNLSEARMVHQDVLPWEPAAQHQEPPQQETKRDELDFDSDDAINRQQRNLACALALGQQVGCSRRQGRSNPETEKAFRLAVTAIAKPIAIAVAQNCNSVPQLTFPHIYIGLSDLFSENQEPPQQERKPMTRAQVEEMSAQEEFLLICDDIESLGQIVEAVERHHGIKE